MDTDEPLRLTQGDMSGTPVAFVEGRRQEGQLVLRQQATLFEADRVSYELVWGEVVVRQTGYNKAAVLTDGRVVLYDPLTVADLEALGGPLDQDPSSVSNLDKALIAREARETDRDGRAALAIERAKAALSA